MRRYNRTRVLRIPCEFCCHTLLRADPAVFHKRYLRAAAGKVGGGLGADDATTDHDDLGGGRDDRVAINKEQWRGHIGLLRDGGVTASPGKVPHLRLEQHFVLCYE